MPTESPAIELHDKASRGLTLTVSEQAQLDVWYAEQDQAEGTLLGLGSTPQRLAALRVQVETALSQLLAVTQRVQELSVQNEAVRREIATLQRQLTRPAMTPSA